MKVLNSILEIFSKRKKLIVSVLIGFVSIFFLKEASYFLYKSSPESQVINSGFYYLSKSDLSKEYDSDSFLFPYHLKILKIDLSPEGFKRYCKFLLYIISAILIAYASCFRGYFTGIFLGFFLLLSPVYLIQNNWIGFADHLTFFWSVLLILFLDLRDRDKGKKIYLYVLFLLFVLGSWTHFYQFIAISFFVLFLNFWEKKEIDREILKIFLLGIVVGRVSSFLVFYLNGIEWNERRLDTAQSLGFARWYSMHTKHILLTLVSFWNGLLFLFLENLARRKISILLVCFGAFFITFFTADTTRVFSHLFYPAWISLWLIRSQIGFSNREKWILGSGLVLAAIYLLAFDPFYKWGGDLIYLGPRISF
ncbi:hypothetical protein [Leptospira johnsonii]|uniref:Glycosyltransferase RgtA/B/C/D-like domain-containing protein n=1 Tax=Leptospira johnsonii TaxID=1917820 RepID=A0A2P2D2E3_9LEPT|nr:hypothetical protein [Leptospira johnsonii]GBF38822.1 hypothetical protein LPTSP1_18170 [Leptospira johnsonii]